MANADDLLESIGLLTAMRVSAPKPCPEYGTRVVNSYAELLFHARQLTPIAHEMIVPGLERALSDASGVLAAIQADPAMPNLEEAYRLACNELATLAAIFVNDHESPPCNEYRRLASTIATLLATADIVKPIWGMIRRERAAARKKPPHRARTRVPHTDPAEYYI